MTNVPALLAAKTAVNEKRYLRADRLLSEILLRDDENREAHLLLSDTCIKRGRFERARTLIEIYHKMHGVDFRTKKLLASALCGLAAFDSARILFEECLQNSPEEPELLIGLASALAGLQKHLEAIAIFERALGNMPNSAEAICGIVFSLCNRGLKEEAVQRLSYALDNTPELLDAILDFSYELKEQRRNSEALLYLGAIIDVLPNNTDALKGLADIHYRCGRYSEAIFFYERLCAQNDAPSEAFSLMGKALQEVGKITEAWTCFRKAIDIDPHIPRYYLQLVRINNPTEGNAYLSRMEDLLRDIDRMEDDEKIDLYFALGSALSHSGQDERGFDLIVKGNALKRSILKYNEMKNLDSIELIKNTFTKAVVSQSRPSYKNVLRPILIIGMPRSGSTLVEQILASHPDVAALGEVSSLKDAIGALKKNRPNRIFPGSVLDWRPEDFEFIGERYHSLIRTEVQRQFPNRSFGCFTDKMLGNFRYVGLARMIFEDVRIIHTRRSPLETCLSCFSINFDELPYTFDLGELGRFYRKRPVRPFTFLPGGSRAGVL